MADTTGDLTAEHSQMSAFKLIFSLLLLAASASTVHARLLHGYGTGDTLEIAEADAIDDLRYRCGDGVLSNLKIILIGSVMDGGIGVTMTADCTQQP